MGKADRKETQSLAKQEIAGEKKKTEAFVTQREGERQEARGRSGALYGDVTENWRNLAKTGGYGDVPETPGYAAARGISETGGYDPAQLAKLETGGFDPTQTGIVRGGYGGLMEHGGVTPEEEAAMIRSTTRGTSRLYDTLSTEAARRTAVTGGYGGQGELAKLGRQSAQQQAEDITKAKAAVAGMRQTGRIAGVQGLGGFETDYAAGMRGGVADVAGGRREGADILARIEADVASGKISGAQGLTSTYGLSLNEQVALGQEILAMSGQGMSMTQSQMQILNELAQQPGVLDTIIAGVGAAAGVGKALYPGGVGGGG